MSSTVYNFIVGGLMHEKNLKVGTKVVYINNEKCELVKTTSKPFQSSSGEWLVRISGHGLAVALNSINELM